MSLRGAIWISQSITSRERLPPLWSTHKSTVKECRLPSLHTPFAKLTQHGLQSRKVSHSDYCRLSLDIRPGLASRISITCGRLRKRSAVLGSVWPSTGEGWSPTDENRAIRKAEAENLSNGGVIWVPSPWKPSYSGYIGYILVQGIGAGQETLFSELEWPLALALDVVLVVVLVVVWELAMEVESCSTS